MVNYYDILGVTESATPDEIKTAYRKLAMKHHPDRGGAADTFKQINEAHDVLSDGNKRQQYDMQRKGGFRGFGGHAEFNEFTMHSEDIQDFIRSHMYGQPFRRQARPPTRNASIRMNIELNLLESIQGVEKTLQYQTSAASARYDASVTIPPGIPHGATIQYPGLGDHSHKQLPRGDLLLTVYIRPHPKFIQDGPHLRTLHQVDVWTMLLGGNFQFETIEGNKLDINVIEGTQPGTIMRVADHGGTDPNTKRRGDCLIELQVKIPTLTAEQKEKLSQITKP
jgi:curved DNA-binding protein